MATVRVKCVCGARLRLPDSVRGSEVRCWHCGNKIMVPNNTTGSGASTIVATPTRRAPEDEWIRVTCKCGKIVKAPPDCAGRKGECPRCQREVMLPGIPVDKTFVKPTPKPKKKDPLEVFYNPDATSTSASGLGDLFGDDSLAGDSSPGDAGRRRASENLDKALADEPTMMSDRGRQDETISTPLPSTKPGTTDNRSRMNLPKPTTLMDAANNAAAPAPASPKTEKPTASEPVPPTIPIETPTQAFTSLDQASSTAATSVPDSSAAISLPKPSPIEKVDEKAAERTAERAEPDFLRVTCSCGKIVKAPLSMSGKIGKCPKCGNSLVMPYASRKSTSSIIPEPMAEVGEGNEGSATAVGFEAIKDPADPGSATPASASVPVIMPPEESPEEMEAPGSEDSNTELPSDFVLTAQGISNKDWEKRRRAKLYQRIKRREGVGGIVKLGAKDIFLLPFKVFSAGSNMSPAMAATIGIGMLALAMGILIYNWPQDYVDAQRKMPVPRRYYYNMAEDRLLELADMDYQRITAAMATTQPDGASYMVRAYVYACGSCETDTRQVLFLERFTPAAQNATLEFEDLLNKDQGGTDRTKALAGTIESGHFIGRFVNPDAPKKSSSTTAPWSSSTQPSDSKSGSSTQPTPLERPSLLDKVKWVTYVSGSSMLNNPLPSCKNNLNQCLPAPKR